MRRDSYKYFDIPARVMSRYTVAALNARAFGSTRYAKTGGYRRSRDKKRVIPGMNPRDKRKPAVIRVSLGAREAHITLGLYRHAPLVSIIFLLLRRGVGRGGGRGTRVR